MITVLECVEVLENRIRLQLLAKNIKTDVNGLYQNKAYQIVFLKSVIKTESELPTVGDFYNKNKEILYKYHAAIKIIKQKLKKAFKSKL